MTVTISHCFPTQNLSKIVTATGRWAGRREPGDVAVRAAPGVAGDRVRGSHARREGRRGDAVAVRWREHVLQQEGARLRRQASYSDIARRLHGCAHGKFSEGRMLDAVWLQVLQGRMLDALRLQGASARRE